MVTVSVSPESASVSSTKTSPSWSPEMLAISNGVLSVYSSISLPFEPAINIFVPSLLNLMSAGTESWLLRLKLSL